MGKEKVLSQKQLDRARLNKVLDFNEQELIKMQGQGWTNLSFDQLNVLENFIVIGMATMRKCPPSYVMVASREVADRAKATGKDVRVIDIGQPLEAEPLTGTGIADDVKP